MSGGGRLQRKLEFETLFNIASDEVQDAIIVYSFALFEKQMDVHYEQCVDLAKRKPHISSELILRELSTYYKEVGRLIKKLQKNEIIAKSLTTECGTGFSYYRSLIYETGNVNNKTRGKDRLSHLIDG